MGKKRECPLTDSQPVSKLSKLDDYFGSVFTYGCRIQKMALAPNEVTNNDLSLNLNFLI